MRMYMVEIIIKDTKNGEEKLYDLEWDFAMKAINLCRKSENIKPLGSIMGSDPNMTARSIVRRFEDDKSKP